VLIFLEIEIEQKNKNLFGIYKLELLFAILAAIFVSSPFVPIINTFFTIFMVEDINDKDAV